MAEVRIMLQESYITVRIWEERKRTARHDRFIMLHVLQNCTFISGEAKHQLRKIRVVNVSTWTVRRN